MFDILHTPVYSVGMEHLNNCEAAFSVALISSNDMVASYRLAYPTEGASDDLVWKCAKRIRDRPHVRDHLIRLRELAAEKLLVTEETVLTEYARIGFSDPRKCFDEHGALKAIDKLDDHTARSIKSFKVKRVKEGDSHHEIVEVHFWPKTNALKALADRLDFFNEKPADDEIYDVEYTVRPLVE